MKKKIFISITVFCALFIMSSTQIKTKESPCKGGIYKTYEDFLNGNLTEAGQFIDLVDLFCSLTLNFKENGKTVKHKKKEENFFGFQNDGCIDHYDLDNCMGTFAVLVRGNIWMVAVPPVSFWDTDGNKWDGIKQIGHISTHFDNHPYFTKDLKNRNSYKGVPDKLMEDDVELYNELKNKKNSDKTPLYIMGLVKRYNELHK